MYKNILIPVDGSKCSQQALDHGLKLAKSVGASISLLHILEDPLTIAYSLPETVSYRPELYAELKTAALVVLEQAEQQTKAQGIDCISNLISDVNPAHAILEASKDADLIIMGTHGRKGLDRVVFGSVTEGVLRRTNTPVLILRCT
ncbi:MAG TPA: universal stress protein [Trueperaceae bacterium]|nr:universal stress protein [Trueperaceae bacterium]